MKKQRIIEIIILVCVFSVIIAGGMIFNHYKHEKPNTYNIVFKDIDSIVKGSPVRFMGINVGHVVKLKRKDKYIICKIRITKEGVKIPDLTRAKVAYNGLGGSKSIELFPPLTEDKNIKGIVADDSLRINDIAGIVRDLEDIMVIISDIVQDIDPDTIMDDFRALTNPEIIERVDVDLQKIVDKQEEIDKSVKEVVGLEKTIIDFTDWANENFNKIFNR